MDAPSAQVVSGNCLQVKRKKCEGQWPNGTLSAFAKSGFASTLAVGLSRVGLIPDWLTWAGLGAVRDAAPPPYLALVRAAA